MLPRTDPSGPMTSPTRRSSTPATALRRLALLMLGAATSCAQQEDDRIPPPPPAPGDPVDSALALEGEVLFRTKGCLACHQVQGGRSVGPDLAGVTERRSYGWIRAIIANPDSMLAEDPVARALLAEYRTRMVYQRISGYEVRAVIEYLRQYPEPWVEGRAGPPGQPPAPAPTPLP
jgi:mono/diheme cytochrome c family protein